MAGKLGKRLLEVFLKRLQVTETCWFLTGSVNGVGYSNIHIRMDGGHFYIGAHRVSYEHFIGPIPEGLQIDHLCRNRRCVNPDHLEAVTCRENLLRGETLAARCAKKSHCPQGHPYDAANTMIIRTQYQRQCRTCQRQRRQAHAR